MTWFWLIPKPAISCIEKFLCVFARFGRFCPIWPICPFLPVLYTSSGTTGEKNSQESLEIIIYIQTASHKNFSMWWPLELSVPTVQTLSDFEDSRPIFLVFQNGYHMWYLMLLWYLWLLSHAFKNFCAFLPFFSQFCRSAHSCPFYSLFQVTYEINYIVNLVL